LSVAASYHPSFILDVVALSVTFVTPDPLAWDDLMFCDLFRRGGTPGAVGDEGIVLIVHGKLKVVSTRVIEELFVVARLWWA
jgi:hypothetical protein